MTPSPARIRHYALNIKFLYTGCIAICCTCCQVCRRPRCAGSQTPGLNQLSQYQKGDFKLGWPHCQPVPRSTVHGRTSLDDHLSHVHVHIPPPAHCHFSPRCSVFGSTGLMGLLATTGHLGDWLCSSLWLHPSSLGGLHR